MLLKNFQAIFTSTIFDVKSRTLLFLYTLIAVIIRLPFFFRDYIDRDESTFILMGQSWVDGYLPYTELWDLKPPFVFLFFAGIIFVFGKSLIAIRFIGTIVIVITSFILYKIGIKMHSKKAGFWIGLLYIYVSSLFGNVQGLMSEHLSMLFFLFALLFLLKNSKRYHLFSAGCLFGIALLMKLNLSYALVLVCLTQFYFSTKKKSLKMGVIESSILGSGVLFSFVLSFIPYYTKGLQNLYIDSVFKAALAYSDTTFTERSSLLAPIIILLVLIFFLIRRLKKKFLLTNEHLLFIIAAILGIVYSFFKIGKLNSHYLIQLYPFLAMLFVFFMITYKRIKNKFGIYGLLVLLALAPIESYLEYFELGKRLSNNESVYYREGIQIPNYLKDKIREDEQVLFLDFHIGYWFLDKKPPTKALTHPSNINRTNLYPFFKNERETSLEELTYIFKTVKPVVIITKNGSFPSFDTADPINAYFKSYLNKHYTKEITIGKGEVYRINSYKF